MKTDKKIVCEDEVKQSADKMTYSHLLTHSKLRGNIVRWYPIKQGQKVLLVSEASAALEEALCEMGADVTAISIESESLEGNESGNVSGIYDIILHVGVLDTEEKKPQDVWKDCLVKYGTLLKKSGTLLLAVPNRLGLKYFAGCQDEQYDKYFAGPEGYASGMTRQAFSKKEYEAVLRAAGFSEIDNYYPYPDHLFPSAIYSDERLPEPGELTDNIRNFDKDRYVLFDEAKVSGNLVEEGVFPAFANAFLFVCHRENRTEEKIETGKKTGAERDPETGREFEAERERIVYSKFSMERDDKFQIRTDIVRSGKRVVRKYPLTKAAIVHVARMESNYKKLKKQSEGTIFRFCPVTMMPGTAQGDNVQCAAEFPWVRGEALQHRLQKLLEQGDETAAEQLICRYIKAVTELDMTEIADVDLIFPNILIDGEVWNVIDYEWSFETSRKNAIPVKWIIYRALFYLSIELSGYELTKLPRLLALAEIVPEEAKKFEDWEAQFQAYLKGDTLPIQHMVDLLGKRVIPFAGNENPNDREAKRRWNLYEKDAKKLFFHLDRAEKSDGKGILVGWACAKTKEGEYIPAHIEVFDREGNPVGRAVERMERADVAAVLKAKTDFPYWGFSVSWSLAAEQKFTLRLNAGKCWKEIAIFDQRKGTEKICTSRRIKFKI